MIERFREKFVKPKTIGAAIVVTLGTGLGTIGSHHVTEGQEAERRRSEVVKVGEELVFDMYFVRKGRVEQDSLKEGQELKSLDCVVYIPPSVVRTSKPGDENIEYWKEAEFARNPVFIEDGNLAYIAYTSAKTDSMVYVSMKPKVLEHLVFYKGEKQINDWAKCIKKGKVSQINQDQLGNPYITVDHAGENVRIGYSETIPSRVDAEPLR